MTQSERVKEAKAFVKTYLEEYRHRVSAEKGQKAPSFYEKYPYNITVYQFPNETIGIIFVPSDKGRIRGVEADFEDVEEDILESQKFMGFFPFEDMSTENAKERGLKDAENDLRFIEGGIEGATARLDILREKIEELIKLNPWLDEEGAFQQEIVDEIEKAIEGLAEQDDRTFELLRLRSFKTRPSEIKVEVSGLNVLEKIREDISAITLPEGNGEDFEEMRSRITDLEDRLTRVGKLLPRIRDQINDLDEKIETLSREGRGDRNLDKQLSEITERLKDVEAEIDEFKKEDMDVPDQIKNTVFRMNRRVYNLAKRVETIEEYLKKLSEKNKKASSSKPSSAKKTATRKTSK